MTNVKDILINNLIMNIKRNGNYSNTKLLEIKYGLETLYITITKLTVILIINILLGNTKELILFILTYGLLKITGFGLHAKKSWQCWITSIPIFTIIPYLIKNVVVNNKLIIIISITSLLIICLYAPADTERRPLINKKKRIIYKIITIFTSIIYLLIIYINNNSYVDSLLLYSLILEALIINPLSYKLFKLKYKNYRLKGGK
jgi:accessory gene regulator B